MTKLRGLSPSQRWGLIVAAIALVLAAINFWWFMTYRQGYPFDIDEAGYTAFGLVDYLGLTAHGLGGWWDAIQGQPTFAPLVPALTSLTVYIHPGVLNGFAVLTAFMVLLALASYGIGNRLAGPRLGAFAAIVAATLPGTFIFSRVYIFALPTAAFLSCAVYAMLRSDGLRSRRWAIACGAAIGLMLLSRTMAIAYVPGVLAAALLAMALRQQEDLGRRLINAGLLIVTAVAVAATWYAKNIGSVIDYLTNYGYGKQSQNYGVQHALISWGRLRSVPERIVSEDLFLPLSVLVLLALGALAVATVRRLRERDRGKSNLIQIGKSDAFGVAVVFICGYAGLMTSQNGGNGFTIPISILLPPLAVVALKCFPKAVTPAVAIAAVVCVLNLVSTATIWAYAAHTRTLSIPGFAEPFPVTKGIPKAVFGFRLQVPGPETVFDASDARWLHAADRALNLINRFYGPEEEAPIVAVASRNRALSSNSIQLSSVLRYHRGIPFVQLLAEPNDSVAHYRQGLQDQSFGEVTVLLTMSSELNDFPPPVTQAHAEAAAKQLGFKKVERMGLPDGRQLYIWQKKNPAQPGA